MRKKLTCILVLAVLMFCEYRFIMHNLKPYRYGDGGVELDFFGLRDNYYAELLPSEYNLLAEVIEIDEFTGLTAAVTNDGNVWEFYAEGLEVGNEVDLVMYDMGTYEIYDDLVVDYIY